MRRSHSLGEKAAWTGADSGRVPTGRSYGDPTSTAVVLNFNLFPIPAMKNITDAPIHVQKREKREKLSARRPRGCCVNGRLDKENTTSLPALQRASARWLYRQSAGVKPFLFLTNPPRPWLGSRRSVG